MLQRPPATSLRLWAWLASLTLLIGLAVEYYAQALGAFIVSDCPSLGPTAPGHCAEPYRLAVTGIAIISAGAVAGCFLLLLALFKRRK